MLFWYFLLSSFKKKNMQVGYFLKINKINNFVFQVQALHALLEQEKLVKARQLCPPGHQRLITLVKQSLEDSGEGGAIAEKIKNSSPMTRDHLVTTLPSFWLVKLFQFYYFSASHWYSV